MKKYTLPDLVVLSGLVFVLALVGAWLGTSLASVDTVTAAPATQEFDGGLVVNITSDNIDRAAMAVNFADNVLLGREVPVTIFLNVEGVRLADANIPQNMHVSGETIPEMLQRFMDDGGTVLVCPMCMENVGGMTEDDLIEGAMVSSPDELWPRLFAEGVTVMSY